MTALKHGLIGAALLGLALFIHARAFNDEALAEREHLGKSYADCKCKPEIKGRELVASLCHAPTSQGPWTHECIYQKPQ